MQLVVVLLMLPATRQKAAAEQRRGRCGSGKLNTKHLAATFRAGCLSYRRVCFDQASGW